MPVTHIPDASLAVLSCRSGYAALVSLSTRDPVWSAEHLTPARIEAAQLLERPRTNFHADPDVPSASSAELDDYRRSGWDRGHMSPDGDMSTEAAQLESFDLGNAVPQAPHLNRGAWERIEGHVRDLALAGDVYVVTGPIASVPPLTIGPDSVVVPSATWKAIYRTQARRAEAWVCSNVQNTICQEEPVSLLERQTHIDLFPSLAPAWLER